MSKNIYRQLNIKFWSDVWVVEQLNALDRYLFIYLLTNDKANDSGIYQISKRMISFETGITVDELENMWRRLQEKVIYLDGYVVFKNGINNKNYNYNTFKGISNILENLPEEVYPKVMEFVYIQQDLLDKIKKDLLNLKGLQGAYKGVAHNITEHNRTEQNRTLEKPVKKTKYKFNDEQMHLTRILIEKIEKNFPNLIKEPNIEQWANDIRLMNETDGVNIELIECIINWVHGGEIQGKKVPENSFWSKNIRSAGKLREKRETLQAEIMQKYKIDSGILSKTGKEIPQVIM